MENFLLTTALLLILRKMRLLTRIAYLCTKNQEIYLPRLTCC